MIAFVSFEGERFSDIVVRDFSNFVGFCTHLVKNIPNLAASFFFAKAIGSCEK